MEYYALTVQQEIVRLGDFDDINEAFDDEPPGTVWVLVFNKDGLRDLITSAKEALSC